MMKNNSLFSRKAMDKLSSPEKLDTLLEVTNPVGWMALAAMVVMVFSVLVWSVFGAMVVKVEGVGILLDSAGIVSVAPVVGGKVEHVFIRSGMRVHKGDIIAAIEQPEQGMETKLARSEMYLSENDREAVTRAAQYDAKKYHQDINEFIISEYDGIIGEVSIVSGSVITAGSSICTVRKDQERDELTGILYVSVDNGKRIEPGMTVQLAPNGVDSAESGSLLAVVRSVSQYPISGNAMMNRLGNQQLTQWVLEKTGNSAMEVMFDLVKDDDSESGYLWTSVVGQHKPITAGSICIGSVIVDRKPPLEKVFYKFSQWLRSR